MSAERLREAAALMRSRAERATSGPWEFRPRRGFESVRENPATVGFNDDAGYFVMFREGTWATEADMGYVASMHPAVALAVADQLDAAAALSTWEQQIGMGPVSDLIAKAVATADAYLANPTT